MRPASSLVWLTSTLLEDFFKCLFIKQCTYVSIVYCLIWTAVAEIVSDPRRHKPSVFSLVLCRILRQPILKPIGNDGAISKIAETFNNKKFVQSPDGGWLLPVSQASFFFFKQNPRPFGFGVHTHTLLIGLTNHTLYITYIIWYYMMKKLEDFMKLTLKYL